MHARWACAHCALDGALFRCPRRICRPVHSLGSSRTALADLAWAVADSAFVEQQLEGEKSLLWSNTAVSYIHAVIVAVGSSYLYAIGCAASRSLTSPLLDS